ncbi:hypothetical protein KX928_06495 [Roseobacter sp. YSTF-M11]|uniref:Type II secretion system protein H n=1 Tax=Roseobacter insulae TaxID=2859783 RepID=A0A9X1JXU0_9RHOB|nr:hypothetical protein [Roseobacter insulae]
MTLIEMLVMLVVIGIMAGAVTISFAPKPKGASAELISLKLVADLRRAVQYSLSHQQGFGVLAGSEGYRFVVEGTDGWGPHPHSALRDLKPFPSSLRISMQDHDNVVFAVSRHLVPEGNPPWQVSFGQGSFAQQVIFDGITARIVPAGGD